MKLLNLLFILTITLITANQNYAQSRDSEQHPTRLPVNVIVDKTSADGNWMKVYEVGGGMHDDLITELFIADDSGINTDELDRLDLVEQYQLLFGLSEMVPHGLITLIAEQQAKELEMADWELVGTPQLQGEDCLMPGENPPPVWPKDIELPPCPEPKPEPIGKEPNPPEPIPPSDGKPLPAASCGHEYEWLYGIYIGGAIMDYYCNNYQGSIDFQEWTGSAKLNLDVDNGNVTLTMGYKKAGGWVYLAETAQYSAESYTTKSFYGPLRKSKIITIASPDSLYDWTLDVSKLMPLFYPLQEILAYPHIYCLIGKIDELDDDSPFKCAPTL